MSNPDSQTTALALLLVAICAPGQIRTVGQWIAPNEHGEVVVCDNSGKWIEMPHPKMDAQK